MKRFKTQKYLWRHKRGQTTVEYILLTGFAALMVVGIKKLVVDNVASKVLPEVVQQIESAGGRQGPATLGGQNNVGYYYLKSQSVKK
jgi:Flp pilus assembly pilin Flp